MEPFPDEIHFHGVMTPPTLQTLYKDLTPEEDLERRFSRLRRGTYAILELPGTLAAIHYNCKGYAAGYRDKYLTSRATLDEEVEFFQLLGYRPIKSTDPEASVEKVAIFVKRDVPCHYARQEPSGRWVSKIGAFELIAHELDALTGEGDCEYGRVAIILVRPEGYTGALPTSEGGNSN